jgi:hypothetical protein
MAWNIFDLSHTDGDLEMCESPSAKAGIQTYQPLMDPRFRGVMVNRDVQSADIKARSKYANNSTSTTEEPDKGGKSPLYLP